MTRVYEASTVLAAEMACVRLRKHGLYPRVEGDAVGIREAATPITVWVPQADAKKALGILAPRKKKAAPKGRRAGRGRR